LVGQGCSGYTPTPAATLRSQGWSFWLRSLEMVFLGSVCGGTREEERTLTLELEGEKWDFYIATPCELTMVSHETLSSKPVLGGSWVLCVNLST
jgi:hypothetical protein